MRVSAENNIGNLRAYRLYVSNSPFVIRDCSLLVRDDIVRNLFNRKEYISVEYFSRK